MQSLWCGRQKNNGQKSSWSSIQKSHGKQERTKQNHLNPACRNHLPGNVSMQELQAPHSKVVLKKNKNTKR